jgi:hypothetical protein
MPIEETFRDWHTGGGVRAAGVALPTRGMVDRLIGVVCLTYSLQMQLGQRVRTDPCRQPRCAQWTVTGRMSWFWCGQHLLRDVGYEWSEWLAHPWETVEVIGGTAAAVPDVDALDVDREAA